ncbi:hypothetical protein MMC24_001132 [Lignoscripta atroalba]|nr:hypothetical protein [Lignoscripta atroalba]
MSYLCGCYYHIASSSYHTRIAKHYLPQVQLQAYTQILSTTSRTKLTQRFFNPSSHDAIEECIYSFPLYDGVSVVSLTCTIGSRVLRGLVKEKNKAKAVYDEALSRGETAGLLVQLPEASDVFSTRLGNIPAGESVIVEITYVGELKHDAEADGIRFTLPTKIAPRYGSFPNSIMVPGATPTQENGGINIVVDANMPDGSFVRGIQSPSHPIAVTMGCTSTALQADPVMHKASATLSLGNAALDRDFVLVVTTKDTGTPKAILETHPTIPNQRALMVTLIPKFSLPPRRPEIVFVVDRSGSMNGKIPTLISAMKVFLKSIPVGVKFNICSFGSNYSFLWPASKSYAQDSLAEALTHIEQFAANLGGTETFSAVKATIENRFTDLPCEVMLLTDGNIWNQIQLVDYVRKQTVESKGDIRVFSLGIGNSVSHAFIEGIARAGNGFAQSVQDQEKLEKKVVRMLKGCLSPHITDYTLEVKYTRDEEDEDFEIVEKVTGGLEVLISGQDPDESKQQQPISLFDPKADPDQENEPAFGYKDGQERYAQLPAVPFPKLLQAPHTIPPLFPFTRTAVYLIMSPQTMQKSPTSVVLRATSSHGPLQLEIPIERLAESGETIHQLAAKKAIQDLEERQGWLYDAREENGDLVRGRFPGRFDEMVEREAVRLGVEYQVGGKWCSFVAVAANDKETAEKEASRDVIAGISKSHSAGPIGSLLRSELRELAAASTSPFLDIKNDNNFHAAIEYLALSSDSDEEMRSGLFGSADASSTPQSSTPRFRAAATALPSSSTRIKPSLTWLSSEGAQQSVPLTGGVEPPQKRKGIFDISSALLSLGAPSPLIRGRLSPSPAEAHSAQQKAAPQFQFESCELDDGSESGVNEQKQQQRAPAYYKAMGGSEKVLAVIALQDFEGWWNPSEELALITGIGKEVFDDESIIGEKEKGERRKMWATMLVVVWLEEMMRAEEGVWDLVVEKARGWLDGKSGFGNLETEARSAVLGASS